MCNFSGERDDQGFGPEIGQRQDARGRRREAHVGKEGPPRVQRAHAVSVKGLKSGRHGHSAGKVPFRLLKTKSGKGVRWGV